MSYDDTIDFVNAEPLEGDWEDDYAKQRPKPEFLIPDSQCPDAHHKVDYSKLMDHVASVAGSKQRRDAIEKVLVF
jgi:hypothetical protein